MRERIPEPCLCGDPECPACYPQISTRLRRAMGGDTRDEEPEMED